MSVWHLVKFQQLKAADKEFLDGVIQSSYFPTVDMIWINGVREVTGSSCWEDQRSQWRGRKWMMGETLLYPHHGWRRKRDAALTVSMVTLIVCVCVHERPTLPSQWGGCVTQGQTAVTFTVILRQRHRWTNEGDRQVKDGSARRRYDDTNKLSL